MTLKKQPGPRQLNFQSLERRDLMASDVLATITNGNLTKIVGTQEADKFALVSTGRGYVLAGLDGTTINGRSQVLFNTISGNLTINTKGGNDYVQLANFVVGKTLTIDLGDGHDELIIQNAIIKTDLIIEGDTPPNNDDGGEGPGDFPRRRWVAATATKS